MLRYCHYLPIVCWLLTSCATFTAPGSDLGTGQPSTPPQASVVAGANDPTTISTSTVAASSYPAPSAAVAPSTIIASSYPAPSASPMPTADSSPLPTPDDQGSDTPTAVIRDEREVYLGNTRLVGNEEAPGCFTVREIVYSPTRSHFLVVFACFETDNHAFVFRADGSDRHQITARWDLVNGEKYAWGEDGQAVLYRRVNSCCIEPPLDAPPEGWVRYDLQTGEKTLVPEPASS